MATTQSCPRDCGDGNSTTTTAGCCEGCGLEGFAGRFSIGQPKFNLFNMCSSPGCGGGPGCITDDGTHRMCIDDYPYHRLPVDCESFSPCIENGGGQGNATPGSSSVYGVCCMPPSFRVLWGNGAFGCEFYTSKTCCNYHGGDWKGSDPSNYRDCENQCPQNPSCCGCDWCCDEVSSAECTGKRVYPWENLPIPKTTACIGTTCPTTPPPPVCRREEFVMGKRPAPHKVADDCGGMAVDRGGRHELHSVGPTRAKDCAPDVDECRTHYAHVGRGAPSAPTTRTVGWLCGQHNRRVAGTKTANRCYPSKRPDGRHSFNCAYRVPCPEKPAVCL